MSHNGSYGYGSPYGAQQQPQPAYGGSSPTLRRRHVPAAASSLSSPQADKSNHYGTPSKKTMVKRLDFMYTKVDRDYTVQTEGGGKLSVITFCVMIVLCLAECWSYLSQNNSTQEHIKVDKALGKRMRVNLNITFHALACEDLHVDAMDVAGDSQIDVEDTFTKTMLRLDGTRRSDEEIQVEINKHQADKKKKEELLNSKIPENYCGSCYGAHENAEDCCQTCDDVMAAYKKKRWNPDLLLHSAEQCIREGRDKREPKRMTRGQGCNLSGYMTVNRVAGNFHIAMGEGVERDGRHIHIYVPDDTPNFNASHTIHELSFGPDDNPALNGIVKIVTEEMGTTGLFQYFLKVVPTTTVDGVETNRYFVTERFRPLMKDVLDSHKREKDSQTVGVHAGASKQHHDHGDHHKIQNSILPGVFFIYEIYPFEVEITRLKVPLTHLLIRLMATVGGVFTMGSWADRWLYSRQQRQRKRGMR